ncbi:MAG: hypothetical protein VB130_01070 [Clostridium sp.]|nr:hypothetical protein [Clostridium sp.]
MGKKKYIEWVIIVVIIVGAMYFISLNRKQRYIKTDNYNNVVTAVCLSLFADDYDAFSRLFMNKDKASREEFNKLKNLRTDKSSSSQYAIIKYSNNEMLLIELTPQKINGEYKIQNIKVVPNEMKKLFD